MSKFDDDFDKAFKFAVGGWFFATLLSLALWGVVIWAIVKLVLHFTG